jgi:hypothetical protein
LTLAKRRDAADIGRVNAEPAGDFAFTEPLLGFERVNLENRKFPISPRYPV